jgi:hypothetical protein
MIASRSDVVASWRIAASASFVSRKASMARQVSYLFPFKINVFSNLAYLLPTSLAADFPFEFKLFSNLAYLIRVRACRWYRHFVLDLHAKKVGKVGKVRKPVDSIWFFVAYLGFRCRQGRQDRFHRVLPMAWGVRARRPRNLSSFRNLGLLRLGGSCDA